MYLGPLTSKCARKVCSSHTDVSWIHTQSGDHYCPACARKINEWHEGLVVSRDSAFREVVRRFGSPRLDTFSAQRPYPKQFRVWIFDGWHIHNGATSGAPCGYGASYEKAAQALLDYVNKASSLLVEGNECGWRCSATYSGSDKAKLASEEFWDFVKSHGLDEG